MTRRGAISRLFSSLSSLSQAITSLLKKFFAIVLTTVEAVGRTSRMTAQRIRFVLEDRGIRFPTTHLPVLELPHPATLTLDMLIPQPARLTAQGKMISATVSLIIAGLIIGMMPAASNRALGAYSTTATDADGNTLLGSDAVNKTQLYERSTDSSPESQQQMGIDPNWANGVSRRSYALKYDGSNDSVSAADSTSLSLTSSFTLEAWFNSTTTSAVQGILEKYDTSTRAGYALRITNTGKLQGMVADASSSTTVTGSTTISTNTWTHAALVYNGLTMTLYLNGASDATPVSASAPTNGTSTLKIGADGLTATSSPFSGLIDEARISDTVRYTSAFNASRRHTEDANTVGLWHFDEGVGTGSALTYDSSTYGNNGTLAASTAAPTWVTGANAIMDGYDGSKGWQTQSGAGNISLSERSSVTDDSAYELKTTGSNAFNATGGSDGTTTGANVKVNDNDLLDLTTVGTLEAWYKINSATVGDYTAIVSKYDPTTTVATYTIDHDSTGTKVRGFIGLNGGTYTIVTSSVAYTAADVGRWIHVAFTWTNGGTAYLFKDGVQVGNAALSHNSAATTGNLFFGAGAGSGGVNLYNYLTGGIDEVRISNSQRYTAAFTPTRRFATDSTTVGLWHFDEGTGTTAADSSGNTLTGTVNNSSTWTEGVYSASSTNTSSQNWALPGYAHRQRLNVATTTAVGAGHGVETTVSRATPLNNKQTRPDGKDWRVMYQPSDTYRALDFDGTDDYVDIEDQSGLDRGDTADLTLEGWFNRDTATTDDVIIAKRNSIGTASDAGYVAYLDATTDQLIFEASDGTDEYSLTSVSTVTTTGWHHFAIVWDQDSAANSEIYIDGADDNATDSGTIGNIGDLSNAVDFRIGSESDGASYFDGKLDEIQVSSSVRYTGAFTPSRTATIPDTNTIGLWHFDEGSGTTVIDSSTNSYHGALSGTPTWYTTDGAVSTTQEVPRFIPHGDALNFDGTGDYAKTATAPFTSASAFTFETWFKPTDLSSTYTLMSMSTSSSGTALVEVNTTSGSIVEAKFSGSAVITGATTMTANTWNHLALVYDPNQGPKARLFLNGVQQGTSTTSLTFAGTENNVTIAGRSISSSVDQTFNGQIDEARVSDAARYTSNFTTSTNAFASDGNTKALWHFDDGTTGADQTGNFNVTVTNATSITNGGKVDAIDSTQFKVVAPVGTSTNDKNYYLYYGNPNEGGSAQSYNSYGIALDGTNDYIDVGNNASLQFGVGNFTISAWVNPTSLGAGARQTIIYKGNTAGTSFVILDLLGNTLSNYQIYGAVGTTGPNKFIEAGCIVASCAPGGTSIFPGKWNLVTMVRTDDAIKIYLNGSDVTNSASSAGTAPYTADASTNMYVGRRTDASANYFGGKMDDLRIYSRALSAPEISALYSNTPSVSNTSFTSQWKFNDTTVAGTTAADATGTNNGTLTGFDFDADSNWTTRANIKQVNSSGTDEPAVSSIATEQESPIFFEYRQIASGSPGAWTTDRNKTFQLTTGEQQLIERDGTDGTGVYVSMNPQGVYSKEDHYMVSSWAIEDKNANRGHRNSFPEKANLIATGAGLDIIDAQTNKLWMNFGLGTNKILGATNGPLSVVARDGRVYAVGVNGIIAIQFDLDDAHKWISTGSSSHPEPIAERNAASATYPTQSGSHCTVTSTHDVALTVISNKSYVAAGMASGGMCLLSNATAFDANNLGPSSGLSEGKGILDYYDTATNNIYLDVAITSGGELYGFNDTTNEVHRFNDVHSSSADDSSVDYQWSTTNSITQPVYRHATVNDITVSEGASTAESGNNVLAIAHALGVDVIQEHTTIGSGTIKHYSKESAGTPSNWSSNRFGTAIHTVGTETEYVTTTLTSAPAGYPLTVEMWIKPENLSNLLDLFELRGSGGQSMIIQTTASAGLRVYTIASYELSTTGILTVGQWHHIAITRGAGGTGNMFVDGVDVGDITNTTLQANTTSTVNIGKSTTTWKGEIDEVRIVASEVYTGAFTPSSSELTAIANTQVLYHFNEGTGQTAYDSSSNGYNGTFGASGSVEAADPRWTNPVIGGSTDIATTVGMYHPAPNTGQALNFAGDGASADDGDYVYVADSTTNNFNAGDFTLSTWLQVTDMSGGSEFFGIFDKWGTAAPEGSNRLYALAFSDVSDTLRVQSAQNCASGTSATNVGSALTEDVWYHVALTRVGTLGTVYVNGSSVGTVTMNATMTCASPPPLLLGITNSQSTEASALKGQLDDMRIYNKALNANEVAKIYSSKTSADTISNLVAQYKFDTGVIKNITNTGHGVSGDRPVVLDATGNGEFGVLKNGYVEPAAADGRTNGPTWTSGSPAVDGRVMWVGANGAGSDDGALTAISLDTDRQIRTITENSSYLPDNDISSLSIARDGTLALVGTDADGAWSTGFAGFVVDDTAATVTTNADTVRVKSGGEVRIKSGGTVRVKPN